MGIFSSITDRFKGADFDVAPNKKLKTIKKEFEENFGLKIKIYKGKILAEDSLTINQLNKKTSIDVKKDTRGIKIKASHTVENVEKSFMDNFGLNVNICYSDGKVIPPKEEQLTLGKALRK